MVAAAAGLAVQMRAGLETDGRAGLAGGVDDLLQTRTSGPFEYEQAVKRPPGFERRGHGVNSNQSVHRLTFGIIGS